MQRPHLIVLVSASLDGRISLGPDRTQFEDMADPRVGIDQEHWDQFQKKVYSSHNPQAEMLGSNALINNDQQLKELPPFQGDKKELYKDFLPEDVVKRPDHKGWLVIVDGRGRIRSGFKGTDDRPGWHALHLVSHSVSPDYLAFLKKEKIPYIITGEEQVDLETALTTMREKLDVQTMLTTSAGRLGGALLRADLIDELYLILRPELFGGFETPSLFDSPELEEDQYPTRLQLITTQIEKDGHILLHYRVDT